MTPARVEPPLAFLAELTHRCPLQCPYCSNPLELVGGRAELSTAEWITVFEDAARLGVMQVHLSGGEPTARRDLVGLVRAAEQAGLYTNLITSGVLLDRRKIDDLAAAGLRHIQLSIQDADPAEADRIAAYPQAHLKKLAVAREIRSAGLALTLNVVVHRRNLPRLDGIIDIAVDLGAERLEVAHAQYHGWALINRAALMPSQDQVQSAVATIAAAARRLHGRMQIDHVVPDYHARRPKACMGGWGRRFFVIAPDGAMLPCHAATSIPGMSFPNVRTTALKAAWDDSAAFTAFRGTAWMAEPCRSCEFRDVDFGGCRCQALTLAGHAAATDPVCDRSPLHDKLQALVEREVASGTSSLQLRRPKPSSRASDRSREYGLVTLID
ncbi:pyrroloquinoline quinone biosynthesis protein PqqE [Bradyrhizobium sp. LHD-71]|uniref:pyrroloquinoline quinone biosynthesis protein PqqE n=1 Tax=Bradyrhizobium sp. LHD-71 TaxID=3072141 RepID=UPI00280DAD8E|nr:pyrroloquinoline quinone biosynthesis protein PqqE [Bradyrhizobium sp. LHD-71]MDQ8727171.1 pyrroloquinoline quinone biosynthesis protein PqqE [Bradyrhizobium sp. LHD-71]